MKVIEPRITVQNTDGSDWLVTVEGILHDHNPLESITFTVLVPRSDGDMDNLTDRSVNRAISLLQQHQGMY